MDRKRIEALRSLASEKILKILDALRVDYNENYIYVTAPCPVHNGDRENAWSYHFDKEIWQCFSRGCQDKYGADVFGLVRGTLDCNFPDACKFVEKVLNARNLNLDEISQLNANKQFIKSTKQAQEEKIYPEFVLDKLNYHDYLEGRNYPRKLIESYQIGVTGNAYKQMSNRLIIPIRNINSQIVGFTGRALDKNNYAKWVHSKGFASANNLFNIDRAKKYIEETGTAIIVEGPFDVLRLEQANIHNSVAIFGRKLHNGQIGLLAKCGCNKLIIALDGDAAGLSGAETAFMTAKAFFDVEIIKLNKKDIGDLTVKETVEIFDDIWN